MPLIGFAKYHALGNDYLVIEEKDLPADSSMDKVRRICDRHYGLGADGILLLKSSRTGGAFAVSIYNPDGSEAEKSGNGLRILSRYLWDRGLVGPEAFQVQTLGGMVECRVEDDGRNVVVEMGRASFWSEDIPIAGPPREVLRETLCVADTELEFNAVTVGNPHCVILRQAAIKEDALRYGPLIETHALFPHRTNVQFAEILGRNDIRIEIWERGAGYTLASGTSSCAVVAAARKLGLCGDDVTLHMPGGTLRVIVDDDFGLVLSGAVVRVAAGTIDAECMT